MANKLEAGGVVRATKKNPFLRLPLDTPEKS